MTAFNFALSLFGLFGWLYVWVVKHYQTGKSCHTQIGIILIGIVWISLVVADTAQHLNPTGGTITVRIAFLIACVLLSPLLSDKDA